MRRQHIVIFATLVLLLIFPSAKTTATAQTAEKECTDIYNEKFLPNRLNNHPAAYKAAKEYLEKCSNIDSVIDEYLKKWIARYEVSDLKDKFDAAYDGNDFDNIYKLGRQIIEVEPDNPEVMIKMGYKGYYAGKTYKDDAAKYAKTAIQMLEEGKAPVNWKPFKDKEETLAWLYFSLGFMQRDASLKDAAISFYSSLKYETSIKYSSAAYIYIANYYESEYIKIVSAKMNKPDTNESGALDRRQNAWLERWADALARAITVGEKQSGRNDWLKTLEEIFKVRYDTADGVNEYIKNIQKTPMPDPAIEP